jgi:hypothetical protein
MPRFACELAVGMDKKKEKMTVSKTRGFATTRRGYMVEKERCAQLLN